MYLRSRYWKNKPLCPPPPQSSLCKVNLLSQGKLSKWKHLKTEWFCKYKDSAIRWQWTRFWNKQNFTNVCNRVHFINRDIQLSHNQSNIYFLWLVVLFLHAKLGPLILASGCSGSLVNLFLNFLFCYFKSKFVCTMFYHFLFVCIKKSFDFSDIRTEPAIYLKFKVEETVRHDGNSIANPCVCWKMKNLIFKSIFKSFFS